MNLQDKQEAAKLSAEYIKEHDLTQRDFALRVGIPKEYINSILQGNFEYSNKHKKYPIPDKNFSMILSFIGMNEDDKIWETRRTEQLTQILSVLEDAKENCCTRVIIGETGSGKSMAKSAFIRNHPNEVISVTVGSEDNMSDLLDKVCKPLKCPTHSENGTRRSKSQKIRDISLALEGIYHHGRKPMLIFDEAEYMKQRALCSIKEFYDNLDGYCAIVLIGTSQLTREIESLRKRDKKGIPQLYRRIRFGIRELPPIDRNFDLFLKNIEDRDLKVFLRRECNNYGELHDALLPCIKESRRMKEPLTLELVKMVLNFNAA